MPDLSPAQGLAWWYILPFLFFVAGTTCGERTDRMPLTRRARIAYRDAVRLRGPRP